MIFPGTGHLEVRGRAEPQSTRRRGATPACTNDPQRARRRRTTVQSGGRGVRRASVRSTWTRRATAPQHVGGEGRQLVRSATTSRGTPSRYAWSLLTVTGGIPPERRQATSHADDGEARTLWMEEVGLTADRIP